MRKLFVSLIALAIGAIAAISVAAPPTVGGILFHTHAGPQPITCQGEVIEEVFDWPGVPPEEPLHPDTRGPVGEDEVREAIPGSREVGDRVLALERPENPNQNMLIVELEERGRVGRVISCANEPGVRERLPELGGPELPENPDDGRPSDPPNGVREHPDSPKETNG